MTSIKTEVLLLTRNYVRSGGKFNRKQQLQRMLAFTSFCQDQGAKDLAQVGQKHVMAYYRDNKNLSHPTIYNHFLAITKLFELALKNPPPRPYRTELIRYVNA